MKMLFVLAAGAALGVGGIAIAAQKLGQLQGERTAEQVYAKTCGYCHGANVGPVILGRQLPTGTIKQIVRQGQNAMPAFRMTEITNTELDKLAAWINASKANPKEHGQ